MPVEPWSAVNVDSYFPNILENLVSTHGADQTQKPDAKREIDVGRQGRTTSRSSERHERPSPREGLVSILRKSSNVAARAAPAIPRCRPAALALGALPSLIASFVNRVWIDCSLGSSTSDLQLGGEAPPGSTASYGNRTNNFWTEQDNDSIELAPKESRASTACHA